jgi:hypothetical protein
MKLQVVTSVSLNNELRKTFMDSEFLKIKRLQYGFLIQDIKTNKNIVVFDNNVLSVELTNEETMEMMKLKK